MKTSLMLASVAMMIDGAVTAQTAAPADQPPAATVTPVQPEAAAPPVPVAAAPAMVAATDGVVTKEGGKYVKDGRPATRTEIANYKKAAKSKPE